MAQLLKCWNCEGKVSSEAAVTVEGKLVCPRCAPLLKKAAEARRLAEKQRKQEPPVAGAAAATPSPTAGTPALKPGSSRMPIAPGAVPKSSSRITVAPVETARPQPAPSARLAPSSAEVGPIFKSGRFLAFILKAQGVVLFVLAGLTLVGGTLGAVWAGSASGSKLAVVAGGIVAAMIAAAFLGVSGLVFWRAGTWVRKVSELLVGLVPAAGELPAAQPQEPRIIMPQTTAGA